MALKKHHFAPRSPAVPDTPPHEPASVPVAVVSPPVVVAPPEAALPQVLPAPVVATPPVIPADAGVSLYHDRAGAPINTGLTEGSSNFATMTASARSILPQE